MAKIKTDEVKKEELETDCLTTNIKTPIEPIKEGLVDEWQLIAKYKNEKVTKITMGMDTPAGAIVKVTTKENGQTTEAMAFCSGVGIEDGKLVKK